MLVVHSTDTLQFLWKIMQILEGRNKNHLKDKNNLHGINGHFKKSVFMTIKHILKHSVGPSLTTDKHDFISNNLFE